MKTFFQRLFNGSKVENELRKKLEDTESHLKRVMDASESLLKSHYELIEAGDFLVIENTLLRNQNSALRKALGIPEMDQTPPDKDFTQ